MLRNESICTLWAHLISTQLVMSLTFLSDLHKIYNSINVDSLISIIVYTRKMIWNITRMLWVIQGVS